MGITNTILVIIGLFLVLIGVAAFFNPNFSRWINVPGGPRLKASVAIISGVIILAIGSGFHFSN
jgi:uncharacterized membrane protein